MKRQSEAIQQIFNLQSSIFNSGLSGLGYVNFWRAYRRKFPAEDVAAAFRLLDRVGLSGYHNTRADALSGGQRQRVGISRALMQQPDLLLVDEPTASLDPKTSRQIMRLLVELANERGTPALVNIHDVGFAQSFADRIIGLAASFSRYDYDFSLAIILTIIALVIIGESINQFMWQEVAVILTAVLGVVVISEFISATVRGRIS